MSDQLKKGDEVSYALSPQTMLCGTTDVCLHRALYLNTCNRLHLFFSLLCSRAARWKLVDATTIARKVLLLTYSSHSWGGGAPSGTVKDVKEEETTIKSKNNKDVCGSALVSIAEG